MFTFEYNAHDTSSVCLLMLPLYRYPVWSFDVTIRTNSRLGVMSMKLIRFMSVGGMDKGTLVSEMKERVGLVSYKERRRAFAESSRMTRYLPCLKSFISRTEVSLLLMYCLESRSIFHRVIIFPIE